MAKLLVWQRRPEQGGVSIQRGKQYFGGFRLQPDHNLKPASGGGIGYSQIDKHEICLWGCALVSPSGHHD